MIKKTLFLFFIILLLSLGLQESLASSEPDKQNSPYIVDVIVFTNNPSLANLPATAWKPYQTPDFQNAVSLEEESSIEPIVGNSGNETLLQKVNSVNYILKKEAHRIKNSEALTLILQTAWRQTILKPKNAFGIKITAGNDYSDAYGEQTPELQGVIKLSQSLYQYFNLNINLLLTQPCNTTNDSTNSSPLQSLQIKENRRIQANQLNYIDAPGFGALIEVKPLALKPQ